MSDHARLDAVYTQFIEQALATGCVWALESSAGFALCPSAADEAIDVLPLWSQPESARRHCKDAWAQHQEVPIAVAELLDDWLPGMHQDLLLIGIDWDDSLEGEDVEPLDLLADFDRAASE